MGLCKFEKDGWECPLDAEEDSDYCYWHQEIDEKMPTFRDSSDHPPAKITDVYLKKAFLVFANLQGAKLSFANLQGAYLNSANLQKADLIFANLQGANMEQAQLQEADLMDTKLQKADLSDANLDGANLMNAELQGSTLFYAQFQGANLIAANIQKANLSYANLQKANLHDTKLQGANLFEVEVQGANLSYADLEGANMKLTIFDSASRLDAANLKDANLHLSYIDSSKSFRNAFLFEQEDLNEKEINERVADSVIQKSSQIHYNFDLLFDIGKIDQFIDITCDAIGKYLFDELRLENKVKPAIWSSANADSEYILYSDILDFITDMEHSPNSKRVKNKINSLLFREEMEHSFFFHNPIHKRYDGFLRVSSKNRFLCNDVSKTELYEASKEVYSKLHHFYLNEGMTFREKHAHYRRAEVDRKLLLVKHKWKSIEGLRDRAQWFFNRFVLKMLTNYGESILRPILISILGIIAFGIIYMVLEGVKVSGRAVNLVDYFYLSMTTFTSLGFADVQPDITVKWMQPLIMAESTMGVAMVALIIFVITYQISR